MNALWCLASVIGVTALCSGLMWFFVYRASIVVAVWLTVNLLIAGLQLFSVSHRHRITRNFCLNPFLNFWKRGDYLPYKQQVWMDAIAEYGCKSDERFMDPHSVVYAFMLLNAFIVVGLFVALVVYSENDGGSVFVNLLLLQIVNTLLYYGTWAWHSWKSKETKLSFYNAVPLAWLVVPLIIVFIVKNGRG